MNDLIAKLEAASGPSRELDVAIYVASGEFDREQGLWLKNEKLLHVMRDPEPFDPTPEENAEALKSTCRPYSSSLDAAMTLVPEGWTRDVDATAPECGIDVRLHAPDLRSETTVRGTHDSEPIATCIACLRARGAQARSAREGE
jgi:hypothetical protein